MTQFDVFVNPVPRARQAYPYVVVLQSDAADTGRDRIVAPLVPKARMTGTAGRMMPYVRISDIEHVLLVQSLRSIDAGELRELRGQLAPYREAIVAALDCLFLGV